MDYSEASAILGNPASLAEAEAKAHAEQQRLSPIIRTQGNGAKRDEAVIRARHVDEALQFFRDYFEQQAQAAQSTPASASTQTSQPPHGRRSANTLAGVIVAVVEAIFGAVTWTVRQLMPLLSALGKRGVELMRQFLEWCGRKMPGVVAAVFQKLARHSGIVALVLLVVLSYAIAAIWQRCQNGPPVSGATTAESEQTGIAAASPPDRITSSHNARSQQAPWQDNPRPPAALTSMGQLSIRIPEWGTVRILEYDYEIPTSAPLLLPAGEYTLFIRTAAAPQQSECVIVQVFHDCETLLVKPLGCPWEVRYFPKSRSTPL